MKLERKAMKIYGEQAEDRDIIAYGSDVKGNILETKDPDVIQTAEYSVGIREAVVGQNSTTLQDRMALDYLFSRQLKYLFQNGVPAWASTETYYKGSLSVGSNGMLYSSKVDDNLGNDPVADLNKEYWQQASGSGGGKNIGEVYFSQFSSAEMNKGAVPGWTGEYFINAKDLYPDFYNAIKSEVSLQKTKEEYDNILSEYGECPYYVVDEVDGSLRFPKLRNYIKIAGENGIEVLKAGLPDHTHAIVGSGNYNGTSNNAFGNGQNNPATLSNILRPASESNPIYGASDTVTPASTTLYVWIYVFNSAVDASMAQTGEFIGALSGKANSDLSNVNFTNDNLVWLRHKQSDLDYSQTVQNITSPYTCPADGIMRWNKTGTSNATVNGQTVYLGGNDSSNEGPVYLPVNKGDVVDFAADANGAPNFVPYKLQAGQNSLQFGLQYAGKFANVSDLQNVQAVQGLWALVGNDADGYYRYYTKPTDGNFTAYEWAQGAKDTTDGDYVVDSYTDDSGNWYRLYKSGWLEQGGRIASDGSNVWRYVTFPRPFANAKYTITASSYQESTGQAVQGDSILCTGNFSPTKFCWFWNATTNYGIFWYATGTAE